MPQDTDMVDHKERRKYAIILPILFLIVLLLGLANAIFKTTENKPSEQKNANVEAQTTTKSTPEQVQNLEKKDLVILDNNQIFIVT